MNKGELLRYSEIHMDTDGGLPLAVSADGKNLAASVYGKKDDYIIRIWDLSSRKVIGQLENLDRPQSLQFSPDGETIATGGRNFPLRLLDTKNGTELRRFEDSKYAGESLTFSPDGSILASAGRARRTVRLWDTATGQQLRALDDRPEPARRNVVVFSPDGKSLATASGGEKDKTVHLWDVATGKELRQFQNEFGTGSLAFSPGSEGIAGTIGQAVKGQTVRREAGHRIRATTPDLSQSIIISERLNPDLHVLLPSKSSYEESCHPPRIA